MAPFDDSEDNYETNDVSPSAEPDNTLEKAFVILMLIIVVIAFLALLFVPFYAPL